MAANDKGAQAPKSNAERQAKLKKARLDAGLVRVELYATPANAEKIRRYAARLKRRITIHSSRRLLRGAR